MFKQHSQGCHFAHYFYFYEKIDTWTTPLWPENMVQKTQRVPKTSKIRDDKPHIKSTFSQGRSFSIDYGTSSPEDAEHSFQLNVEITNFRTNLHFTYEREQYIQGVSEPLCRTSQT